MTGKAHIHDIRNHPKISHEVKAIVDRIWIDHYGSIEDMEVIRKEWERLGKPLCGCGCNSEVN